MSDYLNGFLAILPEGQRRRLLAFIRTDDTTTGLSEEELEQAIRDTIDSLARGHSVFTPRRQSGQTNSSEYNLMMREIYTDLYTLYNESNLIDRLVSNTHQLHTSVLQNIEKDIAQMERRIDALAIVADRSEGFLSASSDTFIDNSRFERYEGNESLYVDGNGVAMPLERMATVSDGELRLSQSRAQNLMHGATISIIDGLQVGECMRSDDSHTIDKAIDSSLESFWGEVILADEPLKVPFPTSMKPGATKVDRGAGCALKITFPHPVIASEVSIVPYAEFPVELLSIGYFVNIDGSSEFGEIQPYNPNAPVYIDGHKSIQFPAVLCTGLVFFIRQEHATKNTYLVPKSRVVDMQMWRLIAAAETDITLSSPFVGDFDEDTTNPQFSRAEESPNSWHQYVQMLAEYLDAYSETQSVRDAVNVIINTANSKGLIQVDKYEYVYGAYDIRCLGVIYNDASIYVSKPHAATGNVRRIALEVEERHPTFRDKAGNTIMRDGSDKPLLRTSVEYYISHRANPSATEWYPILPLGQTTIDNEMLMPVDYQHPTVLARFPINVEQPIAVYRDEELLDSADWTLDVGDNSIVYIRPYAWSSSSIYTIDYTPDGNYDVIDLAEVARPIGKRDVITSGTDRNCTVALEHYPYVDMERIRTDMGYNPVSVTLKGAINGSTGVITQEILSTRHPTDNPSAVQARLLNVTDYRGDTVPAMMPYNPKEELPTFEYCHIGRNVHFTETFGHDGPRANYGVSNGNATIYIDYFYLVSSIRLKIILRRTNNIDQSLTPAVNNYTLKFQCLT